MWQFFQQIFGFYKKIHIFCVHTSLDCIADCGANAKPRKFNEIFMSAHSMNIKVNYSSPTTHHYFIHFTTTSTLLLSSLCLQCIKREWSVERKALLNVISVAEKLVTRCLASLPENEGPSEAIKSDTAGIAKTVETIQDRWIDFAKKLILQRTVGAWSRSTL